MTRRYPSMTHETLETLDKLLPNLRLSRAEKRKILLDYLARLDYVQGLDSVDISMGRPVNLPPKSK